LWLQQFANAGFPCPRLQNPTDHFLGLIDTSLDHVNSVFRFGQVWIPVKHSELKYKFSKEMFREMSFQASHLILEVTEASRICGGDLG
jgi:hypothetical protein